MISQKQLDQLSRLLLTGDRSAFLKRCREVWRENHPVECPCGQVFVAKRIDKQYCSGVCRGKFGMRRLRTASRGVARLRGGV